MRVLALVSGSGVARSDGTYPGARNRGTFGSLRRGGDAWLRLRVVAFGASAARRRGAAGPKGRRSGRRAVTGGRAASSSSQPPHQPGRREPAKGGPCPVRNE